MLFPLTILLHTHNMVDGTLTCTNDKIPQSKKKMRKFILFENMHLCYNLYPTNMVNKYEKTTFCEGFFFLIQIKTFLFFFPFKTYAKCEENS